MAKNRARRKPWLADSRRRARRDSRRRAGGAKNWRSRQAPGWRRFSCAAVNDRIRIFLGPGKIEELRQLVWEHQADLVIFDDELTPVQAGNLEELLATKIVDRTD